MKCRPNPKTFGLWTAVTLLAAAGSLPVLHHSAHGQPAHPAQPPVSVPQKRDFRKGARTTLRARLIISQTTIEKGPETSGNTEFQISVPVDLNRAYAPTAPPRNAAEAKANLGDFFGMSSADPKVEPIDRRAMAEYKSISRRKDGSSNTLTLTNPTDVIGLATLQITEPGSDVLSCQATTVIQGDGKATMRNPEGKETHQDLPAIPVALDPLLKFYFSKSALNKGWESGRPFAVSATASREYDLGDSHYTVTATVAIQVGTVKEEYEVEVFPQDGFKNWLPEAGTDERTMGNRVRFRALLRANDGRASTYYPKKVTVTLEGTSKEPGICLNRPLEDGLPTGKDTFDFRLSPAATQGPTVTLSEDGQSLTFEEDACREQRAFVFYADSFDWGGYTALKVVAEMPNGKKVTGYLTGEESVNAIPLPYRKKPDVSHIGDAFWAKIAWGAKPDNWDAATQTGNTHNGDGLSAYEKYRGLWVQSKHKRLNPKKKDLIVVNEIGGQASGALSLFTRASGIEVVELAKGELPDSRVVNANSHTAHGGQQHGLILTFGSVPKDAVARAEHSSGSLSTLPVSPKECSHIYVQQANFQATNWTNATAAADTNGDIAHELAHGCHVAHHGPTRDFAHTDPLVIPALPKPTLPTGKKSAAPGGKAPAKTPVNKVTVYGANDVEVTARPLSLTGNFGLPGNEASGNVHCIMCYNSVYSYAVPMGEKVPVYCNLGTRTFPGILFCQNANGTEWNAKGHTVKSADGKSVTKMPLFGDATVGDCMSQFQVKDF